MIIAHNLESMNTNRQYGIVTKNKEKASERLASGYKINRAADNAAGLAISEKMRSQVRGLHQASRNVEDGISLFKVADGAMQEISNMVHRIRELCVQAANDTNVEEDREKIQSEVDELCMEIDQISEDTEFNTLKLLNNSWGHADGIIGLARLVGEGNITPDGYLSETFSTGSVLDFANGATNATSDVVRTVRTTHTLITASNTAVTYDNLRMNGSAYTGDLYELNGSNYVQIGTASAGAVQGALSNNTVLTDHGVTTPNALTNTWSSSSSNSTTYTPPSTGSAATATAFNNRQNTTTSSSGGGTVYGKDASGNYVALSYRRNSIVTESGNEYFDYANANQKLASVKIDFKNFNKRGFTVDSLYDTGFNSTCATCSDHYSIKFTTGTGANLTTKSDNIGTHYTLAIGVDSLNANSTGEDLAKLIVDSIKANPGFVSHNTQYAYQGSTLYAFDKRPSVVGGSARNATYDAGVYGEKAPDDKRYPFYIQAGANTRQAIECYLPWVSCERMGISEVDLMSHSTATQSLTNIDIGLDYLNGERTMVGAYVNRLEYAAKNDRNTEENTQAAESRIRDTDMADEMVIFSKESILQQAATSMLAQANQSKQGILSLLNG